MEVSSKCENEKFLRVRINPDTVKVFEHSIPRTLVVREQRKIRAAL